MVKISIITASYNSEKTIEKTIESVNSQNYTNFEHVIIDGKSTDKTLEIAKQFSTDKTFIYSEKDSGIYDALNKGIAKATGDIIGFLHSDDFFASSTVLSEIAEIFSTENTDAVYADLIYQKPDGKIHRYWKSKPYKPGMFLWGWMPAHPTLYIKKRIYEKHGTFDLQFTSAADYELMLRFLHKLNIKTTYLPKVTVIMQTGGKSNATVKNRIVANTEDRLAWKVNNLKPYWFTLYLKPLRKIIQFIQKSQSLT